MTGLRLQPSMCVVLHWRGRCPTHKKNMLVPRWPMCVRVATISDDVAVRLVSIGVLDVGLPRRV